MVKGISRRVIVVDSPDPRVFDQAIFILRNDVLEGDGVSSRQLVDQAVRIAKKLYPLPGTSPSQKAPVDTGHCRHAGRRAHGAGMVSRGAFVMLTCAFLPFFSSLTGGLTGRPAFCFRRGKFVLYWGKLR